MSVLVAWMAYFFYFLGVTLGYAAEELIHPKVRFLVIAPDREFLGNEDVRDLMDDFSKNYAPTLSLSLLISEKR